MSAVYPAAPVVKAVPPAFDEALCAEKIVELRAEHEKITKVLTAGKLIHVVGGTVQDIYRVWDEVEAERVKFRKISPAIYNTLTQYKTGLGMISKHLDATDWYVGLQAELGLSTWAAIHDWFAEHQATIEMPVV